MTLTARVSALTGLGQVLTGGFILVLLTWWFTHWRSRRRRGTRRSTFATVTPARAQ